MIACLNRSLKLIKKLRDISKNIDESEFKNLLADLTIEMADLKNEIVDHKEEIVKYREENLELKEKIKLLENLFSKEKPVLDDFGDKFEGDEAIYCSTRYDYEKKKNPYFKSF